MVSMPATVAWPVDLLDLHNTTPVVDGRMVDVLDGRWLRGRGAAKDDLDAVRQLRDDLQRVVRMQADASLLRSYLTDVRQVPDIGSDGVAWSLEASWPARVVLAWGELERDMPGRLRP